MLPVCLTLRQTMEIGFQPVERRPWNVDIEISIKTVAHLYIRKSEGVTTQIIVL